MSMFSRKGELSAPTGLSGKSAEVARVWVTEGGGMSVSLRDTAFGDDYAAWGLVLVDLARHVANAREQRTGIDAAETLSRIKEGFDAEWEAPTDEPEGQIQDE